MNGLLYTKEEAKQRQELGFIRSAGLEDLPYIVDLCKKESKSIGFIPKMAYESAITGIKPGKRWSQTCNDRIWVCECNLDLVGFVLASFGRNTKYIKTGKIAQICLQTDARMMMRGRLLLDSVIHFGKSHGTLAWQCGCADDLESNLFWRAMGWIQIGQRRGIAYTNTWRQSSDRRVNIYHYCEASLFREQYLLIK